MFFERFVKLVEFIYTSTYSKPGSLELKYGLVWTCPKNYSAWPSFVPSQTGHGPSPSDKPINIHRLCFCHHKIKLTLWWFKVAMANHHASRKNSLSMVIFNSYVSHSQRVDPIKNSPSTIHHQRCTIKTCWTKIHHQKPNHRKKKDR